MEFEIIFTIVKVIFFQRMVKKMNQAEIGDEYRVKVSYTT